MRGASSSVDEDLAALVDLLEVEVAAVEEDLRVRVTDARRRDRDIVA